MNHPAQTWNAETMDAAEAVAIVMRAPHVPMDYASPTAFPNVMDWIVAMTDAEAFAVFAMKAFLAPRDCVSPTVFPNAMDWNVETTDAEAYAAFATKEVNATKVFALRSFKPHPFDLF